MICFKLDGFIIYIKVSFVTNQYCCLSFFLSRWSGSVCLHCLVLSALWWSQIILVLGKPKISYLQRGRMERGGEMLVAFCLQTGLRMMSAGARELGCVCSLTLSCQSAVEALHCSLALHPGWDTSSSSTKKCAWEGCGNAMAVATLPGLPLYINTYTTGCSLLSLLISAWP